MSGCAACSMPWAEPQRGRADEHVHSLPSPGSRSRPGRRGGFRPAQVVASDETGVRIEGTNSCHWVFHCKDAVVHRPDYNRAGRVVDEVMAAISRGLDLGPLLAQQNRGERHQTCLAHLDRDAAFAFEHGCDDLPLRFKLWLDKAFDLARNITDFAASTWRASRDVGKATPDILTTATDAASPGNCKPKSAGRGTSS